MTRHSSTVTITLADAEAILNALDGLWSTFDTRIYSAATHLEDAYEAACLVVSNGPHYQPPEPQPTPEPAPTPKPKRNHRRKP